MSRQRDALGLWLTSLGFAAEVPFRGMSGKRRWRFDWATSEPRPIAVEYDGIGPGHQSVRQNWRDAEKSTEAQLLGWLVIRCNVRSVEDGRCAMWVESATGRTE